MTTSTLAIGLVVSVLGMLVAGIAALLPSPQAHRISNTLLAISALIGTMVGALVAVGSGTGESVILPDSLYAIDSAAHTWPLFYGMVFGLDSFSAIFYTVVSAVTFFVAVYAIPYLEQHTSTYNIKSVNALTALFVFGMQGVLLSTNIIGFMTFWEIMSMTSVFLVMAEGTAAGRKAGFLYLIMTHLGAGAIMAGLFLLSGGALLSDFSIIAQITPGLSQLTVFMALSLILFGFGSKAGLVPFHVWLPEAYGEAPITATAIMSGAGISLAVYGFLRVLLFMVATLPMWFVLAVVAFGLVSAMVGVLYAVVERDLKRLLAYSSVENLGVIFSMIGVALLAGQEGSVDLTQAALYAALFLVAAHALFKSGLFLAAGIVIQNVHSRRLETMGGLANRMPQFSVAVCVLALTAAALPPFGPFVSEWIFLQSMIGALSMATPMLKVVLVVTIAIMGFVAGLALFAMVKLYAIGFLAKPRTEAAAAAVEPGSNQLLPVAGLALGGVLLGVFAPVVLSHVGAVDLTAIESRFEASITAGGGTLSPLSVFAIMAVVLIGVGLIRQLVSDVRRERVYQTWDCGQPITPRMEYTATAFSGPIRFLFRPFLRTEKVIVTTPILATNPWIASRSMSIAVSQVWYDRLYVPVGKGIKLLARLVGWLQHGSVQFYIGLILAALLATMIIAL